MRFTGKTVLVTGANRNLGYGLAAAFLAEGATVFVNGSTETKSKNAVKKLMSQHVGVGTARPAPCDVSDPAQVQALLQSIQRERGTLDVLVNNAAALGVGPSFADTSDELLESVFRVNVFGLFYCSRAAVALMPRGSAIVNIGSNTSECAIRNRSAYIASKGAIDALTRAMALDLAPRGIRVNTVAPGYIHTDRWETLDPEICDLRRANVPLGVEAMNQDIAEPVLFFASSQSSHITGSRLVADGGCHIQHLPPQAER